jgi:sarcosine oxidase subunit gamma
MAEALFDLPGRVVARRLPDAARLVARGGPEAARRIGAAFGVALPAGPCRAAEAGARAALWLGPDEWLLLAPAGESAAIERALADALAGEPASVVDVGHRQVALELAGADAAELLAAGCPLDLDEAAFPPGACTRTLFDKAEIALWRRAPDAFRIEVACSFAPYLEAMLDLARRDLAADARGR